MQYNILLVFDFDHTLVEGNTDIEVQSLVPSGLIPEDLKRHSKQVWTDFMQNVFNYLHKNKITAKDIEATMKTMTLVHGMKELLIKSTAKQSAEVIIISDSNSVFIETILKEHGLYDCVNKVFTNPAYFDESGCLQISYYHHQDHCKLSEKNLCKGDVMLDYLKKRRSEGVNFKKIAYVGDGYNDLCPALKLGKHDLLFARKNFALEKRLKTTVHAKDIQASVHYWTSAADITPHLDF